MANHLDFYSSRDTGFVPLPANNHKPEGERKTTEGNYPAYNLFVHAHAQFVGGVLAPDKPCGPAG